jgi:hypothetical protein
MMMKASSAVLPAGPLSARAAPLPRLAAPATATWRPIAAACSSQSKLRISAINLPAAPQRIREQAVRDSSTIQREAGLS